MPEVRYMLSLLPSYSIWYVSPHVLSFSLNHLHDYSISLKNQHKTTTPLQKHQQKSSTQHKTTTQTIWEDLFKHPLDIFEFRDANACFCWSCLQKGILGSPISRSPCSSYKSLNLYLLIFSMPMGSQEVLLSLIYNQKNEDRRSKKHGFQKYFRSKIT